MRMGVFNDKKLDEYFCQNFFTSVRISIVINNTPQYENPGSFSHVQMFATLNVTEFLLGRNLNSLNLSSQH